MQWMASLVTVQTPDPSVLPAEMQRTSELTEQGVLVTGYIAQDPRRGWLIINADSHGCGTGGGHVVPASALLGDRTHRAARSVIRLGHFPH